MKIVTKANDPRMEGNKNQMVPNIAYIEKRTFDISFEAK